MHGTPQPDAHSSPRTTCNKRCEPPPHLLAQRGLAGAGRASHQHVGGSPRHAAGHLPPAADYFSGWMQLSGAARAERRQSSGRRSERRRRRRRASVGAVGKVALDRAACTVHLHPPMPWERPEGEPPKGRHSAALHAHLPGAPKAAADFHDLIALCKTGLAAGGSPASAAHESPSKRALLPSWRWTSDLQYVSNACGGCQHARRPCMSRRRRWLPAGLVRRACVVLSAYPSLPLVNLATARA